MYVGYLAWEYPTSRLLQHLPLGKYSAICVIVWGGILACFAAASNFSGAVAIRFFLGMFEAAVTPGFALLTSQVGITFFVCCSTGDQLGMPVKPMTNYYCAFYSGTPRQSRGDGRIYGSVSMDGARSLEGWWHMEWQWERENMARQLNPGRSFSW